LTSVRDPVDGVDQHVADSLTGLRVEALRTAGSLADLGAGGGFPGLVLAVALPSTEVTLVESVGKKAVFIEDAATALGLRNVTVVAGRAEAWPGGLGACDVVTARALAGLDVLLEYAAPLLRPGGVLVAWKGRRSDGEEHAGLIAAELLGMEPPEPMRVSGPHGAERHLYLSRKLRPTPTTYPRRAGIARKSPLGGSGRD
jgi:16S rRNA (guanine527-N7)-methyltransferase